MELGETAVKVVEEAAAGRDQTKDALHVCEKRTARSRSARKLR